MDCVSIQGWDVVRNSVSEEFDCSDFDLFELFEMGCIAAIELS